MIASEPEGFFKVNRSQDFCPSMNAWSLARLKRMILLKLGPAVLAVVERIRAGSGR